MCSASHMEGNPVCEQKPLGSCLIFCSVLLIKVMDRDYVWTSEQLWISADGQVQVLAIHLSAFGARV